MSSRALDPPFELLASAWFPYIFTFYLRGIRLFLSFPGIRLNSWFRTPELNRLEGGDEESQHLFALAWDLDVPRSIVGLLIQAAQSLGMVAVDERTHVHVQLFPAGALARAGVRFPS